MLACVYREAFGRGQRCRGAPAIFDDSRHKAAQLLVRAQLIEARICVF